MRGCCPRRWLERCALAVLLIACAPPEWETADGKRGNFADFRGRPLVINYWAIWCKPCIEEIPELNRLAADPRVNARVLGVNFDGASGPALQQQMQRLGIEFPVLLDDPAAMLEIEAPTALPTTFVFASDGSLKHRLEGPRTEAELRALLGDMET